jgi:hypothetical protein
MAYGQAPEGAHFGSGSGAVLSTVRIALEIKPSGVMFFNWSVGTPIFAPTYFAVSGA